jgi:GH25 family lysozyme M1 (1,4-beta-N-acetylmuramidase)
MIIGCDFSHWDGKINFDSFEASNARFAFFKAGQGRTRDDLYFTNAEEAEKRGILHGPYWYVDPRTAPKDQAGAIAAIVGLHPGTLPLAMDYEAPDYWGGSYGGWRNLAALIDLVRAGLPDIRPIVYSNYYYWTDHSPSPIWNYPSYKWFRQFDLWLAKYQAGDAPSLIPGPWKSKTPPWRFWQYSALGNPATYGSNKMAVDLNYWNGDYPSLVAYARQGEPAPVPPVPPALHATTTANLNVRAGAGTTYPIRGTLPFNTAVVIDERANGWAHVVASIGQPLTGWCSETYLRYS